MAVADNPIYYIEKLQIEDDEGDYWVFQRVTTTLDMFIVLLPLYTQQFFECKET